MSDSKSDSRDNTAEEIRDIETAREAVESGSVEIPPDPAATFPIKSPILRGLVAGLLGGLCGTSAAIATASLFPPAIAAGAFVVFGFTLYRFCAVEFFGSDPWFSEPKTPHTVRILMKGENDT